MFARILQYSLSYNRFLWLDDAKNSQVSSCNRKSHSWTEPKNNNCWVKQLRSWGSWMSCPRRPMRSASADSKASSRPWTPRRDMTFHWRKKVYVSQLQGLGEQRDAWCPGGELGGGTVGGCLVRCWQEGPAGSHAILPALACGSEPFVRCGAPGDNWQLHGLSSALYVGENRWKQHQVLRTSNCGPWCAMLSSFCWKLDVVLQEKSALWTQFFPVSADEMHKRHGMMLLLPEVQQMESTLEELLPQLVPRWQPLWHYVRLFPNHWWVLELGKLTQNGFPKQTFVEKVWFDQI